MERKALAAWLRLLITPGIGPAHQRRLLTTFGLPQQLFDTPAADLRAALSPALFQALQQPLPRLDALVAATHDWLAAGLAPQGPTRRLITLADPDYPPGLLETEDPPLLLHAMGAALAAGPLAWPPMLAVVGSRNATPQGLAHARAFARHLVGAGWPVVSGLALGIDGAAHQGALDGEAPQEAAALATVAVLGTGLDRIYPRQHEALAAQIARRGLLLSEFTLGTPPLPENFPRRNRLIAGLTRGTLVVEAAPQSGSLITARLAADMGREVFAIPGSIHSPQSRGCHALIRQGAKLVETAQDMLEELGDPAWGQGAPRRSTVGASAGPGSRDDGAPRGAPDQARARAPASEHDPVLVALGWASASLDALQARTGLPIAQLQARLLELELAGQVGRLPGGLFQRIASA